MASSPRGVASGGATDCANGGGSSGGGGGDTPARLRPGDTPAPWRPGAAGTADRGGGEIVDVNVGGVHFATTRHTLCSALEPRSMLAAMFAGGGMPSRTDRHGCVFIDRDGSRFRQILNYLRSGTVHCDADRAALSELLEEAEYFGLHGLEALLREEINRLELEDDLESMPCSSQQSDVTSPTPPLESGLSSPRPKLSDVDENQPPQNILLPGRACLESSQGPPCRLLHDYTFTLNADF